MNGFDGFIQKKKQDRTIYTEQKQRGLPQEQKQHATVQDIYNKYENRVNEASTFEQRSEYYFRDSEMLRSKAKRYKTLATSGNEINAYSRNYKNHGASKRKKYANKAAESFEKAAALEDKISLNATGLDLYKQREKIMRLRMEGMVNAAMLKSRSSADETYRILKAKLSCLTVLMDQLRELKEGVTNKTDLAYFDAEKIKLELELAKVKKDLEKNVPSTQNKWEKEHGLDGNRDKKNRAAVAMERLQAGQGEPANCLEYSVRRDRNGNPIDRTELEKDNWNREYRQAIEQGDAEKKNRMMTEAFERIGAMRVPEPAEVSKKGILNFYEQNPGAFAEILRFGKSIEALKAADPAAAEYMNAHPELSEKAELARVMAELFADETTGTKITREKKTRYEQRYGNLRNLEQQRAEQQRAGQAVAVPVERQEESEEKKKEKLYDKKLSEMRKAAIKLYATDKFGAKAEKLLKERLRYYETLIDRKVQDEAARQYYKDLAGLITYMDLRDMGVEYADGTEYLPEDQQIFTEREISRLMRELKNNAYRTSEAREATDQLFRDSFVASAQQRFNDLLEARENAAARMEDMTTEDLDDLENTYAYTSVKHLYQIDKKTDHMETIIGGIKASKKLMERLGVSDLHPEVQDVIVKDEEGGEHLGIRYRKMFNHTVNRTNFKTDHNKDFNAPSVMFTPEALKQLSSIRLMQYLLGDATYDSDKNLFFQTADIDGANDSSVTMITAAKSDIFAGNFGYIGGKALERGKENLSPLDKIRFPLLDRELVDNILDMKPGELREIAGGLLNNDQIVYFDFRLKMLQKKLIELKEEDAKRDDVDKVLFGKDDWANPEKLKKLETRLQEGNEQMFPEILSQVRVAGAGHGTVLDQNGEDMEEFYRKLYHNMKEYVTGASDIQDQVKRLLDMFGSCSNKDVLFGKGTSKFENAASVADRVLEEIMSEELTREMYKGWYANKKKLLEKYNEVSERLKDTQIPDELRNEERFMHKAGESEEKARKLEKEHYIYYTVAKENPDLIKEYSTYQNMVTIYSVVRFNNRTMDERFEKPDEFATETVRLMIEENPECKAISAHDEKLATMSDSLISSSMLINVEEQNKALAEYDKYDRDTSKAVLERIVGEQRAQ